MEPKPLSETAELFEFTMKPENIPKTLETPAKADGKDFWDFTFDETPGQSRAALVQQYSQQYTDLDWSTVLDDGSPLSKSPQSQMNDTEMLFGLEPKEMEVEESLSQSFDIFSDGWNRRTTATPPELDNTFALFSSPPKRRDSQRSQRERDADRRSRDSQVQATQPKEFCFLEPSPPARRRDPTQRSQREDQRRSQLQDANILPDGHNQRDSSLSTYRWTPNLGNTSFQTQSSRSQHYPFERRNIFKNSFNFD